MMDKRPKKQRVSKKALEATLVLQTSTRRFLVQREKNKRKRLFQKKTNIAHELLHTERLYTHNITILHKTFLEPLVQSEGIIELELYTSLEQLSYILKVMIGYHDILLQQLEQIVGDTWCIHSKLGGIFKEMSSYLKSYTQYVTHYQPTLRLLKLHRENEKLSAFLGELISPECKGKGLKDFLIMPIQRIPRYNMMLADLLAKTWPDHCDYIDLKEAAEKITSICEHVEFMSDKACKLEKKMEIVKKVHFSKKQKWGFSLTAPHCNFLWEDDCEAHLSWSNKEELYFPVAHIFAFSDVLLVCEARNHSKYRAQAHMLLDEIDMMQKMLINGKDGFLLFTNNLEIKLIPCSVTQCDFFEKMEVFASTKDEVDEPVDTTEMPGVRRTRSRTVRIKKEGEDEIVQDKTPKSDDRRLSRNLSFKNLKLSLGNTPRRNSSSNLQEKPKLHRRKSLKKIGRSFSLTSKIESVS